ncbi:MAG: hypothetical protein ACM3WU_05785 [Bacillota bacterium]
MTPKENGGARPPRERGAGNAIADASYILDSQALLAYLRGDPGGAIVQRVLRQCQDCNTKAAIPAPALSDAYAIMASEAPTVFDDVVPLVEQLPLEAHSITADTARAIADLVAEEPGLSSEQATGLVLSSSTGATLVTGDPALSGRTNTLYVGPREGDSKEQR